MATTHRWLSISQRAILGSCIPIIYGSLIFCGCFLDTSSEVFVSFCLFFGIFVIMTGCTGFIAILVKSSSGLEVTRIVLIVENIIAMMTSLVLLYYVAFVRSDKHIFTHTTVQNSVQPLSIDKRNEHFVAYMGGITDKSQEFIFFTHKWIGYTISGILFILGMLGFYGSLLLEDYKNELDVSDFILESRRVSPTHRKKLEKVFKPLLKEKEMDV